MRNRRRFSLEFKRQVVEELMRGESGPAQLCRKYDVCASLLYHWKDMYCGGRFNNAPTQEGAVRDRVDKLERLAEQQHRLATTLDPQLAKARFALDVMREMIETGGVVGSQLSFVSVGQSGAAQAMNVQYMETPGAEDHIQAALQDPTVVRVASRALGDWEMSAQRSKTDGVRDNADSTIDRVGFHYGVKAKDSPEGWFLLGDFRHGDASLLRISLFQNDLDDASSYNGEDLNTARFRRATNQAGKAYERSI